MDLVVINWELFRFLDCYYFCSCQHLHLSKENNVIEVSEENLGLAVFDFSTGQCIGLISSQGSVGVVHELKTPLLEPLGMDHLGEVYEQHLPSRHITRFGPVIGTHMDEDIHQWIQMADGKRYTYTGITPRNAVAMSVFKAGQLVLMPDMVFESK